MIGDRKMGVSIILIISIIATMIAAVLKTPNLPDLKLILQVLLQLPLPSKGGE